MTKPRLLKKSKTNPDFKSDIIKAFTIISKQKSLYLITLDGILTPHVQDLNFQLTNKFFNTIHRDYKNTYEFLNYLFIIEYGGIISKKTVFNSKIEDLGIHCHCLVNTSLSKEQLEFYVNTSFKSIPDYKITDISKSDTKEHLLTYLLKQNLTGLMTNDSYNFKIIV